MIKSNPTTPLSQEVAMRAVGYGRVSTEEQAREGISLAAQEAKIQAYAELNDLELVDVVIDAGKSGKTTDRDGLQKVLSMVKSGEVQAVVVYKLDRLSRRVIDTLTNIEQIEAAGAAFHSIVEKVDTKSAIGRFFLTITAAFAQMERDTISERTSAALRHKIEQGEHVGRVPYGYQIEGTSLVAIQKDSAVITQILELREDGLTLRAIANELNHRQVPTQRGGRWQAQTVANIIKRAVAA
jgi:DNA invertase Pin-like site-specific DNA recombinase